MITSKADVLNVVKAIVDDKTYVFRRLPNGTEDIIKITGSG